MSSRLERNLLYFVSDAVVTEDDRVKAEALATACRAKLSYRNAALVSPDDALEPADFVAGAVPASYAGYANAETGTVTEPASSAAMTNKAATAPASLSEEIGAAPSSTAHPFAGN